MSTPYWFETIITDSKGKLHLLIKARNVKYSYFVWVNNNSMKFSLSNNQLSLYNKIILTCTKLQQHNLLFLNKNASFQIIKIPATYAVNLYLY